MRKFLFYVWFIVVIVVFATESFGQANILPPQKSVSPNETPFLNAASFALTGSDAARIQVIDLHNCIFRFGSGTFYLNNIQIDRVTFQKKITRLLYSSRIFVSIQLHGAEKVFEQFNPGAKYEPDNASSDYTLEITTDEYDRVVRAWSYIYGHGCTGKRSAF